MDGVISLLVPDRHALPARRGLLGSHVTQGSARALTMRLLAEVVPRHQP